MRGDIRWPKVTINRQLGTLWLGVLFTLIQLAMHAAERHLRQQVIGIGYSYLILSTAFGLIAVLLMIRGWRQVRILGVSMDFGHKALFALALFTSATMVVGDVLFTWLARRAIHQIVGSLFVL